MASHIVAALLVASTGFLHHFVHPLPALVITMVVVIVVVIVVAGWVGSGRGRSFSVDGFAHFPAADRPLLADWCLTACRDATPLVTRASGASATLKFSSRCCALVAIESSLICQALAQKPRCPRGTASTGVIRLGDVPRSVTRREGRVTAGSARALDAWQRE